MHTTSVHAEPRVYLLGQIAVEAALRARRRTVRAVHFDRTLDRRKIEPLRRLCKAAKLNLSGKSRAELDAIAGDTKHGGVVAQVGPRGFLRLDELLAGAASRSAFVVMLDGIEDPYNFGQAVRSLYAAGCDGVVVRPRNWTTPPGRKDTPAAGSEGESSNAAAVVARASAGATELMPMALADSPEEAAAFFADQGLTIAATADTLDAAGLNDVDLTGPLFLLIGGERRGVKRSFLARVDTVLRIPYARPFDRALGTVAAASVIAFELARQRRR